MRNHKKERQYEKRKKDEITTPPRIEEQRGPRVRKLGWNENNPAGVAQCGDRRFEMNSTSLIADIIIVEEIQFIEYVTTMSVGVCRS